MVQDHANRVCVEFVPGAGYTPMIEDPQTTGMPLLARRCGRRALGFQAIGVTGHPAVTRRTAAAGAIGATAWCGEGDEVTRMLDYHGDCAAPLPEVQLGGIDPPVVLLTGRGGHGQFSLHRPQQPHLSCDLGGQLLKGHSRMIPIQLRAR